MSATGGAVTISSVVSGSGTTTPKLGLSRSIANGETVTISYNPATGNTTDANSNELAAITDQAVTNNVAATSTTLLEDDFTGVTIDTEKWQTADVSADFTISQNDYLQLQVAGNQTGGSANYVNYVRSVIDIPASAQAAFDLAWSVTSANRTFLIGYFVDSNNYYMIIRTSTAPFNAIRVRHLSGGITISDFTSTVDQPQRIRMTKTANVYKTEYESSPGNWTQIGSDSDGALSGTIKFGVYATWANADIAADDYIRIDDVLIEEL